MIDNIIYKNIDGIKVAFINKKGFKEKQAMICFNYGSKDNNIIIEDKSVKLPAGIAHFLEHKMFEDEEYNVFDVFNKLGGNVNAFTNFTTTAYYFECVENFSQNFSQLLKFVSRPYFTDENVEKEKGIIEQEIKMYDDDPYWRVFFNLLNIMYSEDNPIAKDIAGKVSDIKQITKDMLYTCYNNFYTKDNALIICCGDIEDEKEIENIIFNDLKINSKKTGIIETFEEKVKNKEKNVELKMGITQKIFNIGFKDENICGKIEENIISNKILLDLVFGTASSFYEKLYEKGIINNSFGFDYSHFNNCCFSVFSGTSKEPEKIIQYIKEELDYFKKNGIKEEDFQRIKRKQLGGFIRQFNFIKYIVSMEADFFTKGFSIESYYKTLENISLKNIENILQNFKDDAYLSIIN